MNKIKLNTGNERTKPILHWAGGKSKLLSQLIGIFPASCSRYFEPFFGGGAVFFSFENLLGPVINDANPELINLYRTVRDGIKTL